MPTPIATGRGRDALILELAGTGPIFSLFLVLIGLFKTMRRATARLTTLERRKKLKRVGTVQLREVGHPVTVYCNCKVGNKLEHDTFVRLICGLYCNGTEFDGTSADQRGIGKVGLT
jgi:hypothetical protein